MKTLINNKCITPLLVLFTMLVGFTTAQAQERATAIIELTKNRQAFEPKEIARLTLLLPTSQQQEVVDYLGKELRQPKGSGEFILYNYDRYPGMLLQTLKELGPVAKTAAPVVVPQLLIGSYSPYVGLASQSGNSLAAERTDAAETLLSIDPDLVEAEAIIKKVIEETFDNPEKSRLTPQLVGVLYRRPQNVRERFQEAFMAFREPTTNIFVRITDAAIRLGLIAGGVKGRNNFLDEDQAFETLYTAIQDEAKEVRIAALEAINAVGSRQLCSATCEFIKPLLKDNDERVVRAALRALNLSQAGASFFLNETVGLASKVNLAQEEAMYILGKFSDYSELALSTLCQLAVDKNPMTRELALKVKEVYGID